MISKHGKTEFCRIAVIGVGNLGCALAHSFSLHGFSTQLGSRNPETHSFENPSIAVLNYAEAARDADLVIITVPDDHIQSTCQSIAQQLSAGSTVLHCSGALDSDELLTAKQQGCSVASAHPLNSFPNRAAAIQTLSNPDHKTFLYCEGDSEALIGCESVFKTLGFTVSTIKKEAKPLYHAASVFACNYLNALMELSLKTAEAAGLQRHNYWQAIQPLILSTLENINQHGTSASLSGPIARGDSTTIAKHLRQLAQTSDSIAISYADLGAHALDLAAQRGELDVETLDKITALLATIPKQ